jgi:hypothetical protein
LRFAAENLAKECGTKKEFAHAILPKLTKDNGIFKRCAFGVFEGKPFDVRGTIAAVGDKELYKKLKNTKYFKL